MTKFKSLFRTPDRIQVFDDYHLTAIDYADAQNLAKHLNDKTYYDLTCSIPFPYTLADANAFIAGVMRFEKENRLRRDWAIRNKEGEQIGGIGLLYSHGLSAHRSEMGYWLAKKYWNQGLMTAVVRKFSDHVFHTTKISRLEALVFEGNDASVRVLEKAGFEREGFLKRAYLKEDNFINAYLFARLAPPREQVT